jgi:hypothetical protein
MIPLYARALHAVKGADCEQATRFLEVAHGLAATRGGLESIWIPAVIHQSILICGLKMCHPRKV